MTATDDRSIRSIMIFSLKEKTDLTNREIAEKMGISETVVNRTLRSRNAR